MSQAKSYRVMAAKPLQKQSSIILIRGMTVFLYALILKRDMAPFFGNVLGLKRVMRGKRDPGLSFGTREYFLLINDVLPILRHNERI